MTRSSSSSFLALVAILLPLMAVILDVVKAFTTHHPCQNHPWGRLPAVSSSSRHVRQHDTALQAVSALVRKAKEVELRKYIADGIDDAVMDKYKLIQDALKGEDDGNSDNNNNNNNKVGPLQETLTRRKGTITVIAEYKRRLADSGYVAGIFSPELLSPEFREFGAAGIAVLADERMGGCTYNDLASFVEDQRRARNEVPGPVRIINSDVIIDEIQIARTAACGANAVVLNLDMLGGDVGKLRTLLRATSAVGLEAIVAVSSHDEAQHAIDAGARMISVVNVPGADAKAEVIAGLDIPEGATVTTIANILHRSDKGLAEVEEAWACRDKGFNCAWVSDALYKAGNSAMEHPGAIIKSMASKSSVRWASPVAKSGRGEGAREYLGDILM